MSSEKQNKYCGRRRTGRRAQVLVEGNGAFVGHLAARTDLRNHSPDGFEWGYGGSGPAQLALAILAHEWGDELAQKHYQDFKADFIAGIEMPIWEITSAEIARWAKAKGIEI